MMTKNIRSRKHRRARSRRTGLATLEFALVLPLFMILLLGTIEIGTAIHASQRMLTAARGGARLASMDWTEKLADGETPNDKVEQDIRNLLFASNLPGDAASVTITHAEGSNKGTNFELAADENNLALFRVEVSIPHSAVSIFPSNFLGSRTLRESVVQRAGRSTLSN